MLPELSRRPSILSIGYLPDPPAFPSCIFLPSSHLLPFLQEINDHDHSVYQYVTLQTSPLLDIVTRPRLSESNLRLIAEDRKNNNRRLL